MGQEQSALIDESIPPVTLASRNLDAVAQYIKDGKAKRIVVMTGAGISTSAGIPDFRSPETGLYANLARLGLPYAEAVFDISYFRQNPLPFYSLAQELYPGKFRPTITHSFVNLLFEKGLLLKAFTQNIDCLEREAGVPGHLIIEAHGSFAQQRCIDCKTLYPDDLMHQAIADKTVPRCLQESCGGFVKPDIVFFGEQLPQEFFKNRGLPGAADLAIVMGTSLTVQPFASLPEICGEGTPRLLINKERVGQLGTRADDVLLLTDCDDGVRQLAQACGWLEELEELWAKTAPAAAKERMEAMKATAQQEKAKTKDEKISEEVEKLTKLVEETLKVSNKYQEQMKDHIKPEDSEKAVGNIQAQTIPNSGADVIPISSDQGAESDSPKTSSARSDPATAERVGSTERSPVDGLGHVFPHLAKKSSL